MVLQKRFAIVVGKAALACTLAAGSGSSLAADQAVDGEITKITKGRTGIMVDLAGDLVLENGATVNMTVDGKQRSGQVTKVTANGLAFIKLNKGLPKAVDVGDTVSMDVASGSLASEQSDKPGAVQLQKGGYSKAYWDEVSYLAAHRKAGTRADLELSFLTASGAEESKGGTIADDSEFAVTDKTTALAGDVGFVGRGGFGGGLLLEYSSTMRVSEADIETTSTGTVDDDKVETERTITEFMPYGQWQSRVKTGDVGYGFGIGIPIRTTESDRSVQIAGVEDDIEPAKTTETGISLEALAGSNTWAAILSLTPQLSGKIKQSGQDDVDHTSSEYGVHFETYGKKMKSRAGIVLISSKDAYEGGALTEGGYRVSGRLDFSMGKINLVPFIDYTTTDREVGDAKGEFTETDIGSRIAKSGVYAPFFSLSLNLKSGTESFETSPDRETSVSGVRVAGGINI